MNTVARIPASATNNAMTICAINFVRALISYLSSYIPSATIRPPPSTITSNFGQTENAPSKYIFTSGISMKGRSTRLASGRRIK